MLHVAAVNAPPSRRRTAAIDAARDFLYDVAEHGHCEASVEQLERFVAMLVESSRFTGARRR